MSNVRIRGRHETLARYGVAAERFSDFVSPELDLHQLDVVLLTVALSGRGQHTISGRQHAISGPSFTFTRVGEEHGLVTDVSGLEVVNVYFDAEAHPLPDVGPPLDVAMGALIQLVGGAVSAQKIPQVPLENIRSMRAVLDLLVSETARPGPAAELMMTSLRSILLIQCARELALNGFQPEADLQHRMHPGIEHVRAYLDQSYLQKQMLGDLAKRAHLERTYFSRLFAAQVGVPVSEYVLQLRIGYAMAQLRATNRPIGEIAAASGFRDLSHFGRAFRRRTGRAPREYRVGNI